MTKKLLLWIWPDHMFRISSSGMLPTKLLNDLSFVFVSFFIYYSSSTFITIKGTFDAPLPWQMNFQQSATPTMEGIIDLHHNIMIFMIYIVIFISYILIRSVMLFNSNVKGPLDPVSRTRHHLSLEIIWTILPLIILFWIALPSFALLYSIDHCPKIDLTIKVIGRQWYWTYEIDTFVKYKMKKPNYTNLKETAIIYELITSVSKNIPHDAFTNNTPFIKSNITNSNNIFFSWLYRILNSDFKLTQMDLDNMIDSYLSSLTRSRDLGGVVEDSFIKNSDHSFGNIIYKKYTMFGLKLTSEGEDMWKQFDSYRQVPTIGDPIAHCDSDVDEPSQTPTISGETTDVADKVIVEERLGGNFVKDKKIKYCPTEATLANGFTHPPMTMACGPYDQILDVLIENFDDIYSDKHSTGFNIFSNPSFFKKLAHTFIEFHKDIKTEYRNKLNTMSLQYPMTYIFSKNEVENVAWFYIRNFVHICLHMEYVNNLIQMMHGIKEKHWINVFSEYLYFNRADYIIKDVLTIQHLYNNFNFPNSDLLKSFFSGLTTGELYSFQQALDKKNIILPEFVEDFVIWYDTLGHFVKSFNERVYRNPSVFFSFLYNLGDGDFSWTKNNNNSFIGNECPNPFIKNLNNYQNWVTTLNKSNNSDINNLFDMDIDTINVTNEHTPQDRSFVKKCQKLTNHLSSERTSGVFLFFHSLFQQDKFKQDSSKGRFYHYLVEFDSCIVSDNEVYANYLNICRDESVLNLENLPTSFCGWWRLLEVDNRLVLPIKTRLRILVTSSDVLHSWAVPSLGVKIDACPGRLNCVYVYIKRPGVFHGQCSELCGVKHGFMPIVVHAVTRDKYNRWFADTCELVN